MATNASLLLFEITENVSVKLCGSISHPLYIELLTGFMPRKPRLVGEELHSTALYPQPY